MSELKYIRLNEVNPEVFKTLLNKQKIREHLIDHDLFDSNAIKTWIKEKIEVSAFVVSPSIFCLFAVFFALVCNKA